ncbi:hypothetical protein [Embleya sp. MST-111070]|uniref:hypothetical protein n=1 Tax=Embleya sp. MST-111070 TaxID=3398231 RepID=UPI003F740638
MGPREIADGWAGLRATSFVDYIDAAAQAPRAIPLPRFRTPAVRPRRIIDGWKLGFPAG